MPDKEVQTIRDLIYYQYAKIIAKSAFSEQNGKTVKGKHYGFIKNTFRDLKSGKKSWSEILREDWQFADSDKICIYYSATENLHREHIIPKSLRIKIDCEACDRIQGIHNQVYACPVCNLSKGTKGLYTFYKEKLPNEKKFYDFIPPLLEKKYLKTMFYCHECAGTLDKVEPNDSGEITVLDIDAILG